MQALKNAHNHKPSNGFENKFYGQKKNNYIRHRSNSHFTLKQQRISKRDLYDDVSDLDYLKQPLVQTNQPLSELNTNNVNDKLGEKRKRYEELKRIGRDNLDWFQKRELVTLKTMFEKKPEDLSVEEIQEQKVEGTKRLMRVHHIFALLMKKIAPYIKASMLMLVHKIVEELNEVDPKQYGAVCGEKSLECALNDVRGKSYDEAHSDEKLKGKAYMIDEWCYMFYCHTHEYHKQSPCDLDCDPECGNRGYCKLKFGEKEEKLAFIYWNRLLNTNSGISKFPGKVNGALDKNYKFNFHYVQQLCDVYEKADGRFENFILNKKVDAYKLLNFARTCKAAEQAVPLDEARKLSYVRSMLCHKEALSWATEEVGVHQKVGMYQKVMGHLLDCVEECLPFKSNRDLKKNMLEEIERVKRSETIEDICKVNISF